MYSIRDTVGPTLIVVGDKKIANILQASVSVAGGTLNWQWEMDR